MAEGDGGRWDVGKAKQREKEPARQQKKADNEEPKNHSSSPLVNY